MPTASESEVESLFLPSNSMPPSIGPPTAMIAGMSRRAAPISIPGTILSQEPSITRPSRLWARAMLSRLFAISSREGRMYFMPPCPLARPSQAPIIPNSTAVPPAR